MSPLMGLGVSRTGVRAVVLDRGRVIWAAERPVAGIEELATALADLAAERPRGVRRARVALDGELVQAKVLEGFPRLSPAKLQRAVALQLGRWFLKNGKPLSAGAVSLGGGRVLAAAAEHEALDAVGDGLAQAGLTGGVGAAVGAWARLLPDGEHVMAADEVVDRVSVTAHRLLVVRRCREPAPGGLKPAVPGMDDGARFFTAYAAAAADPVPAFRTHREDVHREAAWRRRAFQLAVAILVLWISAGAVFGLRVRATHRRAVAERAALGPALDAAIAVERDLAMADDVLRTVQAARQQRSSDAMLLSVLTAALPDSAHLSLLRRERDSRVTLVGYAPSAAGVLAALAGTPGVREPVLQSGITRETVAGRQRERFGIAFTWHPGDVTP